MTANPRGHGGVVLGLFFASGATALVYEVVWSKYLAQMFGSTIQAQTVVLAVFMGGLALGNRLFGGRSDTLRRPLQAYGWIEIAIGIYAAAFPLLHRAADALFVTIGSRFAEVSWALLLLKGTLSVGLLALPTLLMGGTLPLIAAWLQLQPEDGDASRRSARFYSVNSLGAVTGSALAGFYLVQNLGLVATLQSVACLNVVIGLLAIVIERDRVARTSALAGVAPTGTTPPRDAAHASAHDTADVATNTTTDAGHFALDRTKGLRTACLIVGVTGGVSMGLEVLAARSLSLIFGSSLQSFAMVLVAFILGIGLGAGAIASARSPRWRNPQAIAWLLLAAALWVALLVFRIDSWVEFYRVAKSGLARSTVGYVYYQGLAALLSMIVLGVPAALIGAVLPLLIRLAGDRSGGLGQQVGRLLTWNTLGAVAGTLLTGFVLMPQFGLRGSFGVLCTALAAVALFLSLSRHLHAVPQPHPSASDAPGPKPDPITWASRRRSPLALAAGGALALIVTLFALGGEGWRHVMSSGAFRAKETEVTANAMEQRRKHIRILFYEDAPDATVSIEQGDGIGAPDDVGLRINGKTDASSRGDLGTQLLIGHLPLLARPEAQDVFILGLGSGITGGAVLAHPIREVVIAENCEPVIRAAKFFEPWNGGVLQDPRTRIVLEDARTVLKLSPRRYDVIITQPSNPWMAGVGSVFSQEYYQLGASRLKEGGVMVQWFHLYDMHDGIVEMVMRTFGSVFPHVELWDCGVGDIALVGSLQPWAAAPADYARGFTRPAVQRDFARIGIPSVEGLFARQLASQASAFAIPREGRVQSDLFPFLEYEAPRAFYLGIASTMLARFDERTWQSDVAPEPKRQALAALDPAGIRSVFGEYHTVNEELLKLLNWRHGRSGGAGPAPSERIASIPSPLAGPQHIITPRIPARASEEDKALLTAVADLRNRTPAHEAALQTLESALLARAHERGWPHWNQATVAAKAALARGETARAQTLVQRALQASPNDRELQYVARIVERRAATSPPPRPAAAP